MKEPPKIAMRFRARESSSVASAIVLLRDPAMFVFPASMSEVSTSTMSGLFSAAASQYSGLAAYASAPAVAPAVAPARARRAATRLSDCHRRIWSGSRCRMRVSCAVVGVQARSLALMNLKLMLPY